jgi:quercetin dioxygenase-like cupin family protein
VSVLKGGYSPHPPHAHDEEEILLLLSGAADLTLPAVGRPVGLTPGQLVYYPAFFAHTLQAAGEDSAVYLMLKWRSFAKRGGSALSFGRFSAQGAANGPGTGRGIHTELVFQGPTVYLRKLHCHTTTLPPGAGYAPHADEYDVAIVILKGEVETLGERVSPHGVVFCAAGEPHGMRNPGEATAEYLVFELHGRRSLLTRPFLAPLFTLLEKAADPRRWKRKLKSLFSHRRT